MREEGGLLAAEEVQRAGQMSLRGQPTNRLKQVLLVLMHLFAQKKMQRQVLLVLMDVSAHKETAETRPARADAWRSLCAEETAETNPASTAHD